MLSASKLRTIILRRAAKTAAAFDMFPDKGIVVVGFSGGADSMVLLDMLHALSRRWKKRIAFAPVYIDAGFIALGDEARKKLEDFCRARDTELRIVRDHRIADIVESGRSPFPPCFTCSRMRRKALMETAREIGAKTIVLGHHRDDLIETFFLNILFSRRISAIMPRQELFGGLFYIVRPMILESEKYIKRHAAMRAFPTIGKNCPYAGDTRREWIKSLIARMEREYPGIKANILRALFHPKPGYLWGEYAPLAEKLLGRE